jgi:hypothetical protein
MSPDSNGRSLIAPRQFRMPIRCLPAPFRAAPRQHGASRISRSGRYSALTHRPDRIKAEPAGKAGNRPLWRSCRNPQSRRERTARSIRATRPFSRLRWLRGLANTYTELVPTGCPRNKDRKHLPSIVETEHPTAIDDRVKRVIVKAQALELRLALTNQDVTSYRTEAKPGRGVSPSFVPSS